MNLTIYYSKLEFLWTLSNSESEKILSLYFDSEKNSYIQYTGAVYNIENIPPDGIIIKTFENLDIRTFGIIILSNGGYIIENENNKKFSHIRLNDLIDYNLVVSDTLNKPVILPNIKCIVMLIEQFLTHIYSYNSTSNTYHFWRNIKTNNYNELFSAHIDDGTIHSYTCCSKQYNAYNDCNNFYELEYIGYGTLYSNKYKKDVSVLPKFSECISINSIIRYDIVIFNYNTKQYEGIVISSDFKNISKYIPIDCKIKSIKRNRKESKPLKSYRVIK